MGLKNIGESLQASYRIGVKKAAHCPEHGSYTAVNVLRDCWSGCPACDKVKAAAETVQYIEKIRAESKAKAHQNWEARLGRAGIAARFKNCRIDNFVATIPAQQRAKRFAEHYVADFKEVLKTGRSMIFSGGRGTGKNHLACGIASALMAQGYSAAVLTVSDMLLAIKDTYGGKGSEIQAIMHFVKPDLLVLDEFGLWADSDTERRLLFSVVNKRYERCRPTLVLTNLNAEDFKQQIEPRVRDRLRDNGGKLIPFNWESYRG